MASFDLSELVTDLVYDISPPGTNSYENVSEDEWVGRLRNGFWTGFNDGLYNEYIEVDGLVTHRQESASTFPRQYQQLVMMYTSINVLQRELLVLNTKFSAEAGPVKYATEKTASVLKGVLDSILAQRDATLAKIRKGDYSGAFIVLDAYATRQNSILYGDTNWVGN